METREQAAAQPTELPLRPQDELECRRCEVHCDKVVYPGACVERGCPFSYSYEEFGHTYMGCLMKVFAVEIDFELLSAAEARGGFGAVRATSPALLEVPGDGHGPDAEQMKKLRALYETATKRSARRSGSSARRPAARGTRG